MPTVLVLGDVMNDIVVRPHGPIRPDTDTHAEIERTDGGSAANAACWLAAAGLETIFVGCVAHADVARHNAVFAAAGVTAVLSGTDEPTGAIVLLVTGAERTMLTSRGANDLLGPEHVPAEVLDRADHVHLTGYSLLRGASVWRPFLEDLASRGISVSVDPSSAGFLADLGPDRFLRLVGGVGVLLPSMAEALLLTGLPAGSTAAEAAHVLAAAHPLVVVKDGANGAVAASTGHEPIAVAAVPVAATDPTGAGDAFDAGFLAAWLAGRGVSAALDAATATAARAVTVVGARPPV